MKKHQTIVRRRRRAITLSAVALVAVSALMLSGCSSSTSSTSSTGKNVKTLNIGLVQNPDTLDPGKTGLVGAIKIDAQIFDTLIYRLPGTNKYEAGLATSFSANADSTEYTFHLRKGVSFQDGTPFTAAAVKATFDHIKDPATASLTAAPYLGPYKETQVIDDYTAKVVFSSSYPAFSTLAAQTTLGISSPLALKKWGSEYGNHPVGTGPYKLVSWQSGNSATLERNPNYTWGPKSFGKGPAKVKTLKFKVLTDQSAQANALNTGELSVADGLTTQDLTSAKKSGKGVIASASAGMPYGYLLNVASDPTNDLKVRQAIMHGVNRSNIIKALFQGQYTKATSVLTPQTDGYVSGASDYKYDPAAAKKLLSADGWKPGSDGIREKDGKQLTLKMVNVSDWSGYGFTSMSTIIQSDLKEIGIKVTIDNQPLTTAQSTYTTGDGGSNTAPMFYWSSDPGLMKTIYMCDAIKSGFNWGHFCDSSIDKQLTTADGTAGAAARADAFSDVVKQLNSKAVFLPIYNLKTILATNNVKGISFTKEGTPLYVTVNK